MTKKIIYLSLFPLIIFAANLALIWPLFLGGYTNEMGSIESVFIADARFILENFPTLSWNPYWYLGFPFHLFYTPILPTLMALSKLLYPVINLESWYRIYIGLFSALAPVSFYFLAKFLSKKSWIAFLAAVIFSFAPSLGYIMPELGGMGGLYNLAPWRFLTLIIYGEGGHIMGLFFLPLALLFFFKVLKDASWKNMVPAAIFTSLLALTNMIALIGFGVMVAVALLIELLAGRALLKTKRAMALALLSFGLSAFWFNASFIRASLSIGSGGAAGGAGDTFLPLLPSLFLSTPVLLLLIVFIGLKAKDEKIKPVLIALAWAVIFFAGAYFWFNGEHMFIPQPNRYFPEMDMGTALAAAITVSLILDYFLTAKAEIFKVIIYILLVLGLGYFPFTYYRQVWDLSKPNPDITKTPEYKTAVWLQNNTKGERVYASGTTAFWLNTFTNVPQVRGGNDGVTGPWTLHGIYQINTGDNAPKGKEGLPAIDWLRIFNVSYLVVNMPSARVTYHDFKNPERFAAVDGVEEVAKVDGDVIYKIPLEKPSLAQVVKKSDFVSLPILKNGVDIDGLDKYVNYIDGVGVKEAQFSWLGIGKAKILANTKEDEGIAIQISYDPGWKATLDGKQILLKNDFIGLMFIDPGRVGEVEIKLNYGKTRDVWLGYMLTITAVLGLIIYPKFIQKYLLSTHKTEAKEEEEE